MAKPSATSALRPAIDVAHRMVALKVLGGSAFISDRYNFPFIAFVWKVYGIPKWQAAVLHDMSPSGSCEDADPTVCRFLELWRRMVKNHLDKMSV